MVNRLSHTQLRALAAGGAAAALAASAVGVTSASAAAPVPSCAGISFTVLHNDRSGGVTLPAGKYTVSSPNLGCTTASALFKSFLRYPAAIPGWKAAATATGWATYTKNNSSTRFTVKRSGATGARVASCATSALKVTLGPPNATAGTTFYPLKFVNKSKTTCTLRGYPGVSAVTSAGRQIGNSAKRIHASFRTVTLAPGKQQSASVGIIDTGNYRRSACKPVTAAGLKVFPPNARTAVTVKKRFSTCSSKTISTLEVRPVK